MVLLKQTLKKNADSRLGLVVHPDCPASHLLDYNCKFFEVNETEVYHGEKNHVDLEFMEVLTDDLCVPGNLFAAAFRQLNPGDELKWADFSKVLLAEEKTHETTPEGVSTTQTS